jgi:UDP-4-amino-4,6-dideoxy-N-acetyl-beta-L-altrosamine N-acetyltransferase
MINFRKIHESDLRMILRWRTEPRVTRYMSTDIDSNFEKQVNWYNKVVKTCKPIEHWIISHNNNPIGLINLENYESRLQQTSWSFYIGESKHQILGGLIPAYFYNYMFFTRDPLIERINGHIFRENTRVLEMHKLYGVEEIGVLKNHIHKYGAMFDVVLIEMTREKWLLKKDMYKHYTTIFEE